MIAKRGTHDKKGRLNKTIGENRANRIDTTRGSDISAWTDPTQQA